MNKILTFFRNKVKFLLIFAIFISSANILSSYPYGKTGHTATNGTGCSCHSSNSNSGVSLSLSGPTSVNINTSNSYSLTVSQSLSKVLAGVNIAVRNSLNGTVINNLSTSDSYLQLSGSELTHRSSPNNKEFSGGSATFDFTFTAPSTPGTYYIQAISLAANGNGSADNGDVWNWITPVAITVSAPSQTLSITSPNTSLALCANSSFNITWSSTNVTNVKIELSTDGGSTFPQTLVASTPASLGSWMWSIPANLVGLTNKIKITDVNNPLLSSTSSANFSVNLPTQLSEQPTNQIVCSGTSATFRVLANGGNLTYQWRKNGAVLPNTNSNQLNITNAVKGDEGNYDCVVTGSCGNPVTSNVATLTTKDLPAIVTQPESILVCQGQPATLSVTASGANINYQWIKNGNPINGATSSTFTIPNVALADSGNYICLVKGDCNPSATSNSVKITVNSTPVITKNPSNTSVCAGAKLELIAEATGGNLKYVWKKNGLPISGQVSSILLIQNSSTTDEGSYSCQISNNCGDAVNTSAVQVSVFKTVAIINHPVSKDITVGDDLSLSVSIENGGNSNYQWRKNSIDIQGATSANLLIKNSTKNEAGSYDCKITSQCGGVVYSQIANVKVNDKQSGPLLTLLTNNYSFDTLSIKSTSKNITVTGIIKNSGSSDLDIKDINITGNESNSFKILSDKSFILKSGESANLEFSVKPINPGLNTATISFNSNSTSSPTMNISVFGADIKLISVDGNLVFDLTEINTNKTKVLSLKSNSNIPINILNASISGTDKEYFVFKDDIAFPISIPINGTINFNIMFQPNSVRTFLAEAQFQLNLEDNPLIIPISGSSSTDIFNHDINNNIIISSNNNILTINSKNNYINRINIYNLLGNNLFSDFNINQNIININIENYQNGIYMINIDNSFYKIIKY